MSMLGLVEVQSFVRKKVLKYGTHGAHARATAAPMWVERVSSKGSGFCAFDWLILSHDDDVPDSRPQLNLNTEPKTHF